MADWIPAEVTEKICWSKQLFSLRFEAELPPFKAGQFISAALDIDGERVVRPYSLVNGPANRPHEIYFNIVPEGPLSPRLAELDVGGQFWLKGGAKGMLTLDRLAAGRDLWMMATGTAIGPFLSILTTDELWQRFQNVVLVYGARYTQDLSYQESIRAMLDRHSAQLRYAPVVSREQAAEALQGRITTLISDGQLEERIGLTLAPEQSQVMLCGNSGMIEDTTQILSDRGMLLSKPRKPGHIATEKYH